MLLLAQGRLRRTRASRADATSCSSVPRQTPRACVGCVLDSKVGAYLAALAKLRLGRCVCRRAARPALLRCITASAAAAFRRTLRRCAWRAPGTTTAASRRVSCVCARPLRCGPTARTRWSLWRRASATPSPYPLTCASRCAAASVVAKLASAAGRRTATRRLCTPFEAATSTPRHPAPPSAHSNIAYSASLTPPLFRRGQSGRAMNSTMTTWRIHARTMPSCSSSSRRCGPWSS